MWAVLAFVIDHGDGPAASWPAPLLLFQVVLLYPVLEEFAFRGTVQSFLLNYSAGAANRFGITIANVVTSVLFAAAHLLYQPALWALATFFPSLIFGYFRERYDQVLPGLLLHSWYNLGFLFFVM